MNSQQQSRIQQSRRRRGATAIEVLLIFASFVIASIVFFQFGSAVVETYFNDGNQLITSPIL